MAFLHDDYTVAWICALPLEMAAAKAILDEIHNPLPRVLNDYNAYTLGRLCGHNVAMTCLPSGIYGTVSAATVLVQMLSTFQKLQFGLMVGIGGGVPTASNADIRLGDVVVSKPTTTIGGVIQYDFGKTTPNGSFEYVGSLNKPPPVLLSAISQLQSAYMAGEQQIQRIIHEALAKNEFMKRKFSRPCEDRLFHAAYNHQNIPTRNVYDDIDECSACDLYQIVTRPLRPTDEPYIHYGLIASGNNVMKDALTRDQIAQPLGVLCFEMEAAGLMDQLPCLVIRGICDYCDSHKPKKWQGYASLTAAAYTKELLKFVPIHSQENYRQASSQLSVSSQRYSTQENLQYMSYQDEFPVETETPENFMMKSNDSPKVNGPENMESHVDVTHSFNSRSPEDILQKCESYARRRLLWNPIPYDSSQLFNALEAWAQAPGSSMMVIQPIGPHAKPRLDDFAFEVTTFLKSGGYPVLWALWPVYDDHLTTREILQGLIYQAVQYGPGASIKFEKFISEGLGNTSEIESLGNLAVDALAKLSSFFLIFEGKDAEFTLTFMNALQKALGNCITLSKVLLVSYSEGLSSALKELVPMASFHKLGPLSQPQRRGKMGRDLRWQTIKPSLSS